MNAPRPGKGVAGETWTRSDGDKPNRPYALLSDVSNDLAGIVIEGSTQKWPPLLKAAHCRIAGRPGPGGNGLAEQVTYFYPCMMQYTFAIDLKERRGQLKATELLSLRLATKLAIGYEKHTCKWPGVRRDSFRGRVVELSEALREESGFRYAVVITEHEFSTKHYYQLAVPLMAFRLEHAGPRALVVERSPWTREFSPNAEKLLLLPAYAFPIREKFEPIRDLGICVDEQTMTRIDKCLGRLLALPE